MKNKANRRVGRPPKADRNKKIVAMYDDPKRKNSFRSIAIQFGMAESTVNEIYHREKRRELNNENN